jgi:hypothetical protein
VIFIFAFHAKVFSAKENTLRERLISASLAVFAQMQQQRRVELSVHECKFTSISIQRRINIAHTQSWVKNIE